MLGDHISCLRHSAIEEKITRDSVGELSTQAFVQERQHHVGVRKGRTGRQGRARFDDHTIGSQHHAREALCKLFDQPPRRGCFAPIEHPCTREQKGGGAGGNHRGTSIYSARDCSLYRWDLWSFEQRPNLPWGRGAQPWEHEDIACRKTYVLERPIDGYRAVGAARHRVAIDGQHALLKRSIWTPPNWFEGR